MMVAHGLRVYLRRETVIASCVCRPQNTIELITWVILSLSVRLGPWHNKLQKILFLSDQGSETPKATTTVRGSGIP